MYIYTIWSDLHDVDAAKVSFRFLRGVRRCSKRNKGFLKAKSGDLQFCRMKYFVVCPYHGYMLLYFQFAFSIGYIFTLKV